MRKYCITFLIIIGLISMVAYYYNNNLVFKINKNKIANIVYSYEIDKGKIGEFDLTNRLSKEDINSIAKSLNNEMLIPDKNKVGEYTLEHLDMLVLGDRWFKIYKQNDGKFTVMYVSNKKEIVYQTTINSELLQMYFNKLRNLSKSLTPNSIVDINVTFLHIQITS
ncbi:hypothetical protein [Clostridium scatologenes]|uniref:Uncharacterized protein n=1 Tax=Clostridium scatologenes TaxID=1548 RepID=A0A0E3GSA3_CLOSL|nr:hypothetical protein [Clostridium scatologenes]AKA71721.1 hypothetical protein CSCA_4596 [Clostridium scatologenes]